MSQPLVSICIPVYNAEAAIERSLKSILAQNIENSEIIVVDNCSEDRTLQIALEILKDAPNSKVISNDKNIGRIENWNRCIDLAQGRYLKLVMVNDVLLKNSINTFLQESLDNKDVVIVSSMHQFADRIPDELREMAVPESKLVLDPRQSVELVNNGGDPFWALNGMLINLEPVRIHGLRFRTDMPYEGDKLFALQLSQYGVTVFLNTASYLFNTEAKGRFHFTGLKPELFLFEHQLFIEEVGQILAATSTQKHRKYEIMLSACNWFLFNQKVAVDIWLITKIFSDSWLFMSQALFARLIYELKIYTLISWIKAAIKKKPVQIKVK